MTTTTRLTARDNETVLPTFTEAVAVHSVSSLAGITLDSLWICLRRSLTLAASGRALCQRRQRKHVNFIPLQT